MNTSFTEKLLRSTLILPQGEFPGTNSNTLVLNNMRMRARLQRAGNWTNHCEISIYGMRQVDMSAVSVLFGQGGTITATNARALIIVEASSDGGSTYLQVFEGQFQQAQGDYKSLPEVNLHVSAATGAGQQYLPASPSSYQDEIDVAQVAEQLATDMGFPFEDNGVTGVLNAPYLAGTLMDQFRALASQANFDYYFDADSTLVICPKNQGRQGKTAVVVSPTSGLVGYPTIEQYGIDCDVLFTPAIALGSPINIQGSQVPGANGTWYPRAAVDELESIVPDGRWFSHLQCSPFPLDT